MLQSEGLADMVLHRGSDMRASQQGGLSTKPPTTTGLAAAPTTTVRSSATRLAVAATTASTTPSATFSCSGVKVSPGARVQALLDANPVGATFCFAPGIYRLSSQLRPRSGQRLVGAPGAVLNGSRVVTGFRFTGFVYVASGFLPASPSTGPGTCWRGFQGCTSAQDVFLDSRPLRRVVSLTSLATGTYYEDFGANRIYLKDNPAGHLVEQAYAPGIVESFEPKVLVKGFVIEKAANPGQTAAVRLRGSGSLVEGNEIRLNHGTGVGVYGSTIRNNKIHHNGQMGMGANGPGVVIERNEVAYNNYAGYSWWWEAGGAKFCFTTDMVVRGNDVHHNRGPGLWTDIDNLRTTYDGNRATANLVAGIEHEISYDAVIRNNVLERNGAGGWDGQLYIYASPNVRVYGNTMRGTNGITLAQSARGTGKYGPHELRNISVRDNTVIRSSGSGFAAGLVKDVADESYFTSRNIVFGRNSYQLPSLAERSFRWSNRSLTASEWRSVGLDADGSFGTT